MPNRYYIRRNDKVRGPFSEERLRELYADGKLRDSDFLSIQSDGGWESVHVVLNRRPSKRATAKVIASSTLSGKGSRRSLWIVLGLAAMALIGVGVWRIGFSGPDVAEIAANAGVPSEIAPQPPQDDSQGGHPTTHSITVEFGGFGGASIGWVTDGKLERRQVAVPGKTEFQANTRQQLFIDNVRLAGLEDVAFYPTLGLRTPPDSSSPSAEPTIIKLDLNEKEFRAAHDGTLVTKVWYTKHGSPTVIESLSNLTSSVSTDVESLASQQGKVVAVFHMGNRVRNLEVASPDAVKSSQTFADKNSSVESPVDTVQVQFVGLDGMSIGWVADGKEFRPQMALPCRTDIPAGEERKLILENIPVDDGRDVVLMPTLEVMAGTPLTAAYLEHCAIRVEFTERDLPNMKDNSSAARVLSLSTPESATNDRGFIPALTVKSQDTESGADLIEPHGPATIAILRLNGSIAWKGEPPAAVIRPSIRMETVLASSALAEFTSAIPDESHKNNFSAAIRKLVESEWNKINSATPILVIGHIRVPDEKMLPQLNGLVMPLKGGYFAAILAEPGQGKLPFYAPGCRPVFVPVDDAPVDGVLDVGSHQMSPAKVEDLIAIRLHVVDEAGKPLPAGHVKAISSLGLRGHEGYYYKPEMFGFSSIAKLHSWNDRRFFARDGTKVLSTVDKSLKIANDGTIEFRSELGPLQLVIFSPPKQTKSLGVGLLAYPSGQPTDLGKVILHDKVECQLTEMRSADAVFHQVMEVSEFVVPGESGHFDMTTIQQHTGLRRYLQLSQLEKQLYLEQFSGSIEGITELGDGPIANFRNTDIAKVELSSLSEFNRENWDESGSIDQGSSEADLEQKFVRTASGPRRNESIQINSGRVYLVKIGPRIENEGLPLWVLFTVSDVSPMSGVLPSPGTPSTASNNSALRKAGSGQTVKHSRALTNTGQWLRSMLTEPISAGLIDYPGEASLQEVLNSVARYYSAQFGNGLRMRFEADQRSFRKAGLKSLTDLKVKDLELPPLPLSDALTQILNKVPDTKLTFDIKGDTILIIAE